MFCSGAMAELVGKRGGKSWASSLKKWSGFGKKNSSQRKGGPHLGTIKSTPNEVAT